MVLDWKCWTHLNFNNLHENEAKIGFSFEKYIFGFQKYFIECQACLNHVTNGILTSKLIIYSNSFSIILYWPNLEKMF